jgi:hypothetical protein
MLFAVPRELAKSADEVQSGRAADIIRRPNLTHLRHQRAIFAVMHSGILQHRRANVRP